MQYDTLQDEKYVSFFKNRSSVTEIGLWLEVVESLAEAVGLKWRGRKGYPFDWHCHCGMLVGYTPEEREKLIDEAMERFRAVYGAYPKSVGSWLLDAYSLRYIADRYKADAVCICKEQWGTDGYTLWGGYFNQAYYPSVNNMLCPAQTKEKQIDIPVFRMLGSDPIDQYDIFLKKSVSDVITMEPGCKAFGGDAGGHVPEWVDWYIKETFCGNGVSFQYTQIGQENSCFTWEHIKDGLGYQLERVAEGVKAGKLEVLTLGESGRWIKGKFAMSPVCTQTAFCDFRGGDRGSVWINTKNYRMNIYWEGNIFHIRDFYLFHENYRERYLDAVCTANDAAYDNLPVLDGLKNSTEEKRAGIFAQYRGQNIAFESYRYEERDAGARLEFVTKEAGKLALEFTEDQIRVNTEKNAEDFSLCAVTAKPLIAVRKYEKKRVLLEYNGYEYALDLGMGTFGEEGRVIPEKGQISVIFRKSV